MNITILSSTDAWHSHSSMRTLGVFTNDEALKQYLVDMKSDGKISGEDMKELMRIHQTQGKELNYLLEEWEANPSHTSEGERDKENKHLKSVKCPICTKNFVRCDFDFPQTIRCCEACGCDFDTSGEILLDPRKL